MPTPAGTRTACVQRTYDLAGNPANVTVTGFGSYAKTMSYATPYCDGTGYGGTTDTHAMKDLSLNLLVRAGLTYWGGLGSVSYRGSGGL